MVKSIRIRDNIDKDKAHSVQKSDICGKSLNVVKFIIEN